MGARFASTEAGNIVCTPCNRSGQQVAPEKFCEDCNEYFCSDCLVYHRKFSSTKDHKPVYISDSVGGSRTSIKAVYLREIDLAVQTDTNPVSEIWSTLRLPDGRFLVCDFNNKSLKMLDGGDYKVVDHLQLPGRPCAVCLIDGHEVAVSLLFRKEVVFISLSSGMKISYRTPVKTSENCRGVVFVNGELYVATGGHSRFKEAPGKLEVFALSGTRVIEKDADGRRLFRCPAAFAVNSSGSEINVVDLGKDVITINPTGKMLRRVSPANLDGASGICMDDEDNMFLCGQASKTIVLIGKDGSNKVILSENDGIVKPGSVCFDPEIKRLLISMYGKNGLYVYQLEQGSTHDKPCVSSTHDKPCVSSTHNKPCVSSTHDKPCVSTTHDKPCVSSTHDKPCV